MGKKTEPELDEEGNPIPPQHQETDPEGDNHVLNICLTNIHFKLL